MIQLTTSNVNAKLTFCYIARVVVACYLRSQLIDTGGYVMMTLNIFRGMSKLPGLSWENEKDFNQFDDTGHGNEKLIRQKQKQTSISDFLG